MASRKETVWSNDSGFNPGLPFKLGDAIEFLQKLYLGIPEAHRDSAKLKIEPYDEYGALLIDAEVYYKRPETAQEKRAREEDEAFERRLEESREKELLDRLKAKYEAS